MAVKIPKVDEITYLDLGQQGENLATSVTIDMTAWVEKWPLAMFYIIHVRSGETVPYIANTEMQDGLLTWTLEEMDTANRGVGYAEIRAVGLDGLVKKTKIIKTVTDKSLTSVITKPENALDDYIQQLLSAATVLYRSRFKVVTAKDGMITFSGGSVEEGGYLLDATLTEEGRAADAQAVGKALEEKADKNSGVYDPLLAYPVGSLYWSSDPTDPHFLFGGKWERVENVVVLAASDAHPVGSVGGAETVTLTTDNIPQ